MVIQNFENDAHVRIVFSYRNWRQFDFYVDNEFHVYLPQIRFVGFWK